MISLGLRIKNLIKNPSPLIERKKARMTEINENIYLKNIYFSTEVKNIIELNYLFQFSFNFIYYFFVKQTDNSGIVASK